MHSGPVINEYIFSKYFLCQFFFVLYIYSQISSSHHFMSQSKLNKDYRNEIRVNLLRSSGMKEQEVDDLMEKLMKNMAIVEEKIGLEQARQRRVCWINFLLIL